MWPTLVDEMMAVVDEFHFSKNPESEEWIVHGIRCQHKMFQILSQLTDLLVTSPHITLCRRRLLIQELQELTPRLIEFIHAQEYPEAFVIPMNSTILNFFGNLCSLVTEDAQLIALMTEFLFKHFAPLLPNTFQCIRKLLLKEKMHNNVFQVCISCIIQTIEAANVDLFEFLSLTCDILFIGMPVYHLNAASPGFFDAVRNILGFCLANAPRDQLIESQWKLWAALLHTYVDDMELGSSSVYLILHPMINDVIPKLYELLPTVIDGSKLVTSHAMSCLWEPIVAALQSSQGSDRFDLVCACFAMTVKSSSWDSAGPICCRFMEFTVTVEEHDETIVDTVCSMKLAHNQMSEFRPLMLVRAGFLCVLEKALPARAKLAGAH